MSPGVIDGYRKSRVVSLGTPKWIGEEYFSKFSLEYDFSSVLDAHDREQTIKLLPEDITQNGPIDAVP